VEKPGFRLCDILVKPRPLQARALGAQRQHYLRGCPHVALSPSRPDR
jgi:hypothetical protein